MATWQAIGDAPTTDEAVYVSDGLAGLVRHDLRLNPQHPPLAKALEAIPVLFAEPYLPHPFGWRMARERRYSRSFWARAHRAWIAC